MYVDLTIGYFGEISFKIVGQPDNKKDNNNLQKDYFLE